MFEGLPAIQVNLFSDAFCVGFREGKKSNQLASCKYNLVLVVCQFSIFILKKAGARDGTMEGIGEGRL